MPTPKDARALPLALLLGCAVFLLGCAVFLLPGCAGPPPEPRPPAPMPASKPTASPATPTAAARDTERELLDAIHRGADYLARACMADGRFVYRVHLDPEVQPSEAYNVLRHAGTLHAMINYQRRWPSDEVGAAIERGSRFLRDKHMAALPHKLDMLAIWEEEATEDPEEAKLGGAGLALLALSELEGLRPASTPLDELRALGSFIGFMQKQDGSFHSKYFGDERGRSDAWTSLYYPGEAALGVLMLQRLETERQSPDKKSWKPVAAKALEYLSRTRRGQQRVPPDHWALLASAELLRQDADDPSSDLDREAIIGHAVQIANHMLSERPQHAPVARLHGCFDNAGRTTPTATRLEGLQAVLELLPPKHDALRARIASAVGAGIAFLMRAQVRDGRYRGGMPRAITKENERAGEIRIDYVQHALSAFIQYYEAAYQGAKPAGATMPGKSSM
jgi:hypothetical protein